MYKLAFRLSSYPPNLYEQCTPTWESKDDAIAAAKEFVDCSRKEGNPVDCIAWKRLRKGCGKVVWDSECNA